MCSKTDQTEHYSRRSHTEPSGNEEINVTMKSASGVDGTALQKEL